ncbi:50S ribosomal protein L25 [Alkalibacter saccharofermentans]|uniref:Large ribosomal subunit protein bL25 n=1 Tax=Alkalibacter saccharofermentans DSM 14828 TaxID=1120975 RepID=A0A1M4X3H0_9FIRM|nr:50S ribosomal protein L25 [Alkalibacter saccharofermentans]SHE88026.1 large subunit ribosomal protein L25 [Alkalibacter saccharofermentans DSM 14828]
MKISCVSRDQTGTGVSRKLRKQDFIPGVVYGGAKKPEAMAISQKDMHSILKEFGTNAILDLEMNGKSYHVMLKEMQRDPILGDILHVDFQQVSKTQRVQVQVPIHILNAENLNNEGALVHHLDELHIECLSGDIPKSVSLDVEKMQVGENYTVSDILVDKEVVVLNDPGELIVSLSAFNLTEEESSEDERTEPIVIGEEEKTEE